MQISVHVKHFTRETDLHVIKLIEICIKPQALSHARNLWQEINKVALAANDDKRVILPDKENTHAIGYC